ncbi:glycosyltransferase family 39 protein [Patescibacteria group bacterium]|nr:glycosyltransferase family 39 protein [Patescibacteria group bacterium]
MKNWKLWLIVGLALFVRLINLDELRLTHDEMSIGYNAYSILKTGKDEWGRAWPMVFQAFGDYKLPVYIYAVVPSIAFLGLSSLAVKLPSILAGSLLVVGIYWLVKQVLHHEKLALLAALIVAVSPWSVHLSRMAFESNLALAMFVFGFNLVLYQISSQKKSIWISLVAGLLLGLTFYTYVAFRLIVAVLALGWLGILLMNRHLRPQLGFVLLGLGITLLPLIFQMTDASVMARLSQLSSTQSQGVEVVVIERHNFCFLVDPGLLSKICRRVFSIPEQTIQNFVKDYVTAISPNYLFLSGDSLEYLQDPGFGQLAWILMPFYVIGLVLWLKRKQLVDRLVLVGFLLSAIPSALVGSPQAVRLSALLPFVVIFITYGFDQTFKLLPKKLMQKLVGLVVAVVFLFLTTQYLLHYWFIYPHQYRNFFYPMGPEVAELVLSQKDKYQTIYITEDFADAHILLAFAGRLDPDWYQANIIRPEADEFGFQHPTQLGNFLFGPRKGDVFLSDKSASGVLYLSGYTDDLGTTQTFKGFSGVHTEVNITDIDLLRQILKDLIVTNLSD